MRGDRPAKSLQNFLQEVFTPHARGSTCIFITHTEQDMVYPACAGIDLCNTFSQLNHKSLPRMRGDRPFYQFLSCSMALFTPHARGSTLRKDISVKGRDVYPACAGIDLKRRCA